ncbi:hypothetical protein FRACA_2890003 [Frankia canadensis]|uniref:Uncharacterized protein n=1 Tax=Frankia canadensis TaxID=1836972 RepID=A0A2I2KT96_9ACTN|nr:hypothetical protein FRACA_2890003 [Frankia canadensis]SOU56170.1 hypothetical protein FRACA_2890003 [Frankia canadensis]
MLEMLSGDGLRWRVRPVTDASGLPVRAGRLGHSAMTAASLYLESWTQDFGYASVRSPPATSQPPRCAVSGIYSLPI